MDAQGLGLLLIALGLPALGLVLLLWLTYLGAWAKSAGRRRGGGYPLAPEPGPRAPYGWWTLAALGVLTLGCMLTG
jgi:hypothetical protein